MGSVLDKGLSVSLAVLCSGALLYLAVPRAVASFLAMPGNPMMQKVQTGEPLDGAEARALALSRHRALAWIDSPASWSEAAFAELRLAYDRRTAEGRPDPDLLAQAVRSTENALRGSPTDSEAWMRLAYLRYAIAGVQDSAARALGLAFMTGVVRPKQIAYRLDLAFRLWPALSPDERRLVMQFVRNSWRHAHEDIVAAATTPLRLGILRAAFASEPAMLANFEALSARRAQSRPPAAN